MPQQSSMFEAFEKMPWRKRAYALMGAITEYGTVSEKAAKKSVKADPRGDPFTLFCSKIELQ